MDRVEMEERMEWIDRRSGVIEYEVGCLQHEKDTLDEEWQLLEDKLYAME